MLLFFGSLIIHELGHAFAARREGIQVQRIELFLFGGTTYMSRDTQTPGEEFRIAAAGPLGTLLFIAVCFGVDLALVGPHRLIHAIELDGTVQITPVLLALSWLLPMNILILIFNIVPAYPLDGGRIARALDLARDRRQAARHPYRGADRRGLRDPARRLRALPHAAQPELRRNLADAARVHDLAVCPDGAQRHRGRLPRPGSSGRRHHGSRARGRSRHQRRVEQALDESFLRYQTEWLPVVDGDGRFIGIARRERAQELVDSGQG